MNVARWNGIQDQYYDSTDMELSMMSIGEITVQHSLVLDMKWMMYSFRQ